MSSLADIGSAFEDIERMHLVPFDNKAVGVLVAAALIPMIPLVGTAIPIHAIVVKLVGLLF